MKATDIDNYNKILSNKINIYGSRESIRSQLSDFAKEYLELKDVDLYKTSFLSYVIDVLSIITANQTFYTSTIYREFFMITSQLDESVINLANWIGYKPESATPSTVDVMLTIPLTFSSPGVNFIIPTGFQVKAENIPFTVVSNPAAEAAAIFDKQATINISSIPVENTTVSIINNNAITVRDSNGFYRPVMIDTTKNTVSFILPFVQQITTIKQFMVPKSLQFYQFYSKNLAFDGMVAGISVYVREPKEGEELSIEDEQKYNISEFDEWTESESGLYTLTSTAKQYVWRAATNEGELFFGNGVLGRQPSPGSKVLVLLYITKGESGKIIPNSISSGDALYYYSLQTGDLALVTSKLQRISYSVTNQSSAVGGTNTPSNPEIKHSAIVNLRSKQRFVSKMDYEDINTILGPTFPVVESIPILKRSDIKINEIMVFLRLYYHDKNNLPEIVPTRNTELILTNITYSNGKYVIPRKYEIYNGGEKYETIFNTIIDQRSQVAYYDYILNNLNDTPAMISKNQPFNESQKYIAQSFIQLLTTDYNVDFSNPDENTSSSSSLPTPSTYPLVIKMNMNHIPSKEITFFRIKVITKWANNSEYYGDDLVIPTIDFSSAVNITYKYFTLTIHDYTSIPSGTQRIEYEVQGLVLNESTNNEEWFPLHRYFSDVIIRQDLSDVMMSTVTTTRFWEGTCHDETRVIVHNTPVILSSYLDDTKGNGVLNNKNQRNFELVVIQNTIKTLDFYSRRMLTDFINIKVPDTHGTFNNLKYNSYDYSIISRYNTPFGYTGPSNYQRTLYTVSGVNLNPACQGEYYDSGEVFTGRAVYKQKEGVFAIFYSGSGWVISDIISLAQIGHKWSLVGSSLVGTYSPSLNALGSPEVTTYQFNLETGSKYIINAIDPTSTINLPEYINCIAERTAIGTWSIITPTRDTYAKINDEFDSLDDNIILAYTDKEWIDVQKFNIPIEIYAKVRVDSKAKASNEAIIQQIKMALLEHFIPLFGMDKTLDRSEIISTIRSVSDVVFCDLITPEIDIRYNYDINKLTQKQLLNYTPQYVGFTEDSVEIDILYDNGKGNK